jgi:protein TonB
MKTTSHARGLTLALLLLGVSPMSAGESSTKTPAIVISTVTPAYPYLMRRAEGTAEVTVAFTVNARGVVTKASVLRSDQTEFNAAALDAIKKWTFTPATKNGVAVDTKVHQTFKFSVVDSYKVTGTPVLVAEKVAR